MIVPLRHVFLATDSAGKSRESLCGVILWVMGVSILEEVTLVLLAARM
jgi:hypothetical protein